MALINFEDSDPWIVEYDACEKLFRDIMEQITVRNGETKVSQAFGTLSANIRMCMKQYTNQVQQLRTKVDDALMARTITTNEAERRTRQVELLQSKDVQLHKLYDSRINDFATSRASLLSPIASTFAEAGTTTWAADDDDDDDDEPIDVKVSVHDLMSHQEQTLKEQDKGLEELCKVIARQRQIGQTISNEVDHQNEIIDDLADHMDRTDESLLNKTKHIQNIHRKDRTCYYWVIIVLLFISIIVIALY